MLRVGVQNNGERRLGVLGVMVSTFKAAFGTVDNDFRHAVSVDLPAERAVLLGVSRLSKESRLDCQGYISQELINQYMTEALNN